MTTIVERDQNGEAFHHTLQCWVKSISYSFSERHGRLDMPTGSCCDMIACIVLFVAIDPDVRSIETFAGDKRDTVYVWRCRDTWEAIDKDGTGMGAFKLEQAK